MIDRFGKTIFVGWAEHEVLWLEAAMSLPFLEQQAAYRDIAALTGRTEGAIRYKAGSLVSQQNRSSAKQVMVPEKPAARRAVALQSAFAAPSKAQLTAGNGRLSRRRPLTEAAE